MIEKNYKLIVTLLSDTLIGSGNGFGATIDSDVVFDEYGLPYIPAKRIKGCLVDSYNKAEEMFIQSGILKDENGFAKQNTFGIQGQESPANVYFDNLYLKSYSEYRQWLEYLNYKEYYPEFFHSSSIIELMTSLRRQTTIENGVAKDTSLRTQRVLNSGIKFEGSVKVISKDIDIIEKTLVIACN